jgi:hypothetical protein
MMRKPGPMREKVTESWRDLGVKKLRNSHFSPDIYREVKSRRMTWMRSVAFNGHVRDIR